MSLKNIQIDINEMIYNVILLLDCLTFPNFTLRIPSMYRDVTSNEQ